MKLQTSFQRWAIRVQVTDNGVRGEPFFAPMRGQGSLGFASAATYETRGHARAHAAIVRTEVGASQEYGEPPRWTVTATPVQVTVSMVES